MVVITSGAPLIASKTEFNPTLRRHLRQEPLYVLACRWLLGLTFNMIPQDLHRNSAQLPKLDKGLVKICPVNSHLKASRSTTQGSGEKVD